MVSRVYHLDRGYVRMEEALANLGASIERVQQDPVTGAVVTSADGVAEPALVQVVPQSTRSIRS